MTNPGRKRRKRKTVLGVFFRLFFVLLLLSMLAAYISNQVAISSKRAELQTLQEQISQQQTKNEEMQRILSGDSDEVTEWVARDSYNYAAANERIFGCDGQLKPHPPVPLRQTGYYQEKNRSIELWQLR